MLNIKKCQVEQDEQSKDNQQVSADNQEDVKPVSFVLPAKKKVRSEKQREASRRNGGKGHGPNNTDRTRYNATKHAFRSPGLTPWDNAEEYEQTIDVLKAIYPSCNPLDIFLIEQSALDMVRVRRMDRLEAQNITEMSSRSDTQDVPLSSAETPTIHFAMIKEYAGQVLDLSQRYKTATMNSLFRKRRELERIPREEISPESNDTDIADGDVIV